MKALKYLKDEKEYLKHIAKKQKIIFFNEELDEAIAELEEFKITRREWYQKGYNQAAKSKKIKELKQKVSEVFANTKIKDKYCK